MAAPVSFSTIAQKAKPTFTQAGSIHKGGKKGSSVRRGWQGGDELPHFRLEIDPRWYETQYTAEGPDKGKTVAQVILERLENRVPGWPEPKVLRVRFPLATYEQNCFWRNDAWAQKGGAPFCTARCDGEVMSLEIQDMPGGKSRVVKNPREKGQPKPCAAIQGYDAETGEPILADECPKGCTSKLTTAVILPDLGLHMTWLLTTTSTVDFHNFRSALGQFDGQLNAEGLIFNWIRHEEMITPKGGDRPTRCWPITVELDPVSSALFIRTREIDMLSTIGQVPTVHPYALLGDDDQLPALESHPQQPAPTAPAPKKAAGVIASEVSSLRNQHDVTAQQVKDWISKRTSENAEYGGTFTHPAKLSDSDYQDLLAAIRSGSIKPTQG